MLTVILLIAFLSLISVSLISLVTSESTRSDTALKSNSAFQAAEAGLDDYLSKLVDDKSYYLHSVSPAESTRRPTSGADVDPLTTTCNPTKTGAPAVDWTGTATWTYPNGKDNWCQLANGYEYNLQITPPSATNLNIQIVSTGRKMCTPVYSVTSSCAPGASTTNWRAVQEWVHWSLVSDFQMLTDSDYSAGATATTNGKIYAGIDANNVKHDIDHQGTATANLYAEGDISGPASLLNGAQKYDHSTIRTQITSPILFSKFTSSLDDLKSAAQADGEYFDASYPVWKFVFLNNGNFTAQGCNLTGGNDPGGTAPTCSAAVATYQVPTNGAVYVETTATVSGVVNGRVTIATNDDMIIGGNISYVQSGDDVLGLIGKNDVIVAKWAAAGPNYDLNWRAAVIAQNGARHSWTSDQSQGTATHLGSTASNGHPFMDQFDTRVYNYDTTLQYLPPPWFPTIDDAYNVALFREIKP